MSRKPIYARSVYGRPEREWETLEAHSLRVAKAARARAGRYGGQPAARLIGLVHDLGKVKPQFQARLRDRSIEVNHSAEGARLLLDEFKELGRILAPPILGHHGRMPDDGPARRRLEETAPVNAPAWMTLERPELPQRLTGNDIEPGDLSFRLQFYIRMLYSCLTDADDRSAAAFEAEIRKRVPGPRRHVLNGYDRPRFSEFIDSLTRTGPVNKLRREILDHAIGMADSAPGLFTLTVPTGGGKTLASLGFGLHHAHKHGLRRIIHVAPFTSIVEQTADAFRRVMGNDAVLEHHAAADWEREDESEEEQLRIAGQSWDMPVVVTTAVQFFESLFSARKKRCRKLHSLAGAVIVIDEAQAIPLPFLRPCLRALTELMEGYGATVVLSTATQPSVTVEGGFPAPEALTGARELALNPRGLYERLRRVNVRHVGHMTDAALAGVMQISEQALLIVNNRVQAREIFEKIRHLPGARHLSTLMVPGHRRAVLAQIRRDLAEGLPVKLVSTSLIEAGVDVDFPLVLRAEAGIDSVAQAAGRCNREGLLGQEGRVLIFQSEHPAPQSVARAAAIGREVMEQFPEDPICLEAVDAYFAGLWRDLGPEALDRAMVPMENPIRGILNATAWCGFSQPYTSIDLAFRLIDEAQFVVLVRGGEWGVSEQRLREITDLPPAVVAAELQAYAVSIPKKVFDALEENGYLNIWREDLFEDQFIMVNAFEAYDSRAGLTV